jgi:hypothetical protein
MIDVEKCLRVSDDLLYKIGIKKIREYLPKLVITHNEIYITLITIFPEIIVYEENINNDKINANINLFKLD